MKQIHVSSAGLTSAVVILLLCSVFSQAQQTVATNTNVVVPPLVNFSGVLTDASGKPITGTVAVTFSFYSEQTGGAALWMETQNVQPDSHGHYTVMLGSTSSTGLPSDIFVAGEAHWLGVQVQGEDEQPLVLLVSAPYALKAGDAQTLGGLPASAFVLAAPASGAAAAAAASEATPEGGTATAAAAALPLTTSDVTTTGGTVNAIPIFTTATNIQNSLLTQTGKTAINVVGKLNLPATGTATSSAGFNSRPQDFVASVFNSSTGTAVPQTFQLQAEPRGNDTASASGTLNLLYGSGTTAPAETGLKIGNTGLITFATGQTFPGTGDGTITGVTTASGSGLSGGGTSGTLSLSIPSAGVTNAMLANSSVTLNANSAGGVTAPGPMTLGSTYTIGLQPCSANQVLQFSGSVWACATASTGTITGVTAGTDLTGGGTTGNVTLNLNTAALNAAYPQLAANNTFTGTQTINNVTTVTGTNSLGVLQVTNTGTSGNNPGIVGTTNSTGSTGVKGFASATSGITNGVYGSSASSAGYGVQGSSPYVGVYGTSPNVGVYGSSSGGGAFVVGVQGASSDLGVYGQASGASSTGVGFDDAGVWGNTAGTSQDYIGVLGTADDNNAGAFYNNSGSDTSGYGATLYALNNSGDSSTLIFQATNSGGSWCVIFTGGDLSCTGTVSGTVRAGDGARRVMVHSVQSPENWFEDFGSGTLANGAATVALDPTFASTVNTATDYHVFLTPNGDCKGLYVSQKSADSFEVRELGGGQSSFAFDYRIVAKRAGYENQRLEDVTERYQKMQEDQRLRHERMQQRRAERSAATPVALGTTPSHR